MRAARWGWTIAGAAIAAVAVFVAAGLAFAACAGKPPDLGTIRIPESKGQPGDWQIVTIEGVAPSSAPITAARVEIAEDGTQLTAFFQGGDPACYAVTDVDVVRRDPEPPQVTVWHGLRLGVMGCNAALWGMAIVVPLDPPFRGG